MLDFEGLPAWARRRLVRRFERGASERIVRWISLPAGRAAGADKTAPSAADAPSSADNLVVFVPRPEAAPARERPRALAAG